MSKVIQRQKSREQKRQVAKTTSEWRALAVKALAAAQKVGDRRALGIETAISKHTEARTLKALHIVCDNDIEREFSATKS